MYVYRCTGFTTSVYASTGAPTCGSASQAKEKRKKENFIRLCVSTAASTYVFFFKKKTFHICGNDSPTVV